MTGTPTLLSDTRATVRTWPGFHVRPAPLADAHAPYGFVATHDDVRARLCCVCKRTLHDGLASFMRRLVDLDARPDDVLVEFVGATPTLDSAYCFDPETVRTQGEVSEGESAKGVETEWLEIPVGEFGVLLGDYITGRKRLVPPHPASEPQAVLGGEQFG